MIALTITVQLFISDVNVGNMTVWIEVNTAVTHTCRSFHLSVSKRPVYSDNSTRRRVELSCVAINTR